MRGFNIFILALSIFIFLSGSALAQQADPTIVDEVVPSTSTSPAMIKRTITTTQLFPILAYSSMLKSTQATATADASLATTMQTTLTQAQAIKSSTPAGKE